MRLSCQFCLLLLLAVLPMTALARDRQVQVSINTDEAEAVLSILSKKANGLEIRSDDWNRVFQSEGFVRLKKRELALSRPFSEDDFRTFVFSDDLFKRREALAKTLAEWKTVKASNAANRALAYLPQTARIAAKIYPVIKPRENSFVFEIKTDPAIFLYLDPKVEKAKFENTLAHELHHIGFGTACPSPADEARNAKLPENSQKVIKWMGAFGEGLAMLAAAGGPDIHPHAVSQADERERWNQDIANFNTDLKRVESFFLNVASGKLTGDAENNAGFEFFGIQGPWYTVGWKMAVVIEKTEGRDKLIECFCDTRKLFRTYNEAAIRYNKKNGTKYAYWSEDLLRKVN